MEDDGGPPLARFRTLDVEEIEQEVKEEVEQEVKEVIVNNKYVSNFLPCFDEFFDCIAPHHHNIIQTTHIENLYYFPCLTTPAFRKTGVRVERKEIDQYFDFLQNNNDDDLYFDCSDCLQTESDDDDLYLDCSTPDYYDSLLPHLISIVQQY